MHPVTTHMQNVDAEVGHSAGVLTSLILTAMMGSRLAKTKKIMPAGVLVGLGGAATLYHAMKWQEWRQ